MFNCEDGDKVLLVTIADEASEECLTKILEQHSIQNCPLTDLQSNDEDLIKKVFLLLT